jgi:hypothetical protein
MKMIANGLLTPADEDAGEQFCCDLRHFTRVGVVGTLTKIPICMPILEVLDDPLIPLSPIYPKGLAVEIA